MESAGQPKKKWKQAEMRERLGQPKNKYNCRPKKNKKEMQSRERKRKAKSNTRRAVDINRLEIGLIHI